jgi:phage-related protein
MRINESVSPVPSPTRSEPGAAPAKPEGLFDRIKDGFEKVVSGGEHVVANVVNDVESVASTVVHAAENAASTVVHDVEDVAGSVVHAAENVVSTVAHDVENVAGSVAKTVEKVASIALDGLDSLAERLVEGGEHFFGDVVQGAEHVGSWVRRDVSDAVHHVEDAAKHLWTDVKSSFEHSIQRESRFSSLLGSALTLASAALENVEHAAKQAEDLWSTKIEPTVRVENKVAPPVPAERRAEEGEP